MYTLTYPIHITQVYTYECRYLFYLYIRKCPWKSLRHVCTVRTSRTKVTYDSIVGSSIAQYRYHYSTDTHTLTQDHFDPNIITFAESRITTLLGDVTGKEMLPTTCTHLNPPTSIWRCTGDWNCRINTNKSYNITTARVILLFVVRRATVNAITGRNT